MSRRARALRCVATTAVAVAAATSFSAIAQAEPAPLPIPMPAAAAGVQNAVLDASPAAKAIVTATPEALQRAALERSAGASDAVAALLDKAGMHKASLDVGVTVPQQFLYPAPTLGCAVTNGATTATLSTAQAGPNFPIPPWIESGSLRFQAVPGHIGIPSSSNLTVAWFNTSTLQGGMTALDDNVAGIPTLSKTVVTGHGPVLAAVWGDVGYADGANCSAVPTVGSFTA